MCKPLDESHKEESYFHPGNKIFIIHLGLFGGTSRRKGATPWREEATLGVLTFNHWNPKWSIYIGLEPAVGKFHSA